MTGTLRVIDSGVTEGRLNIAIGQALIEQHRQDLAPDTLRFLRFPPTALIGRHQALAQEVDVAFCRQHGIGLARRICEAAAAGLGRLGIEARFRPRNDIEVDGRKLGGTGGFFDGDTLFFQGTVLVDLDSALMVSALKVPRAKLEKHALDSAAQRVVTLRELLGADCPNLQTIQAALAGGFESGFGLGAEPGELDGATRTLAQQLFDEEIGQDDFVNEIEQPAGREGILEGEHTGPGGTVRTYLSLQGPARNRIGSVLITGDFFVTPPRVVYDLEGVLRGLPLDRLPGTLDCFFRDTDIEVLSVGKDDFLSSLQAAIDTQGAPHDGH